MGKLTPEQVVQKPKELKGKRENWESHWRDVSSYFLPTRREINERPAKGQKRTQNLLDNTGIMGVELLASGLQSMLTNPNLIWFELTTGDERLDDQDNIREWLQEQSKVTHNILNNSNFNTEVHQMYLDLITFGTAGMSIEEDPNSVIRFSTKHIKDLFIVENNYGFIDQVFRCFEWTADKLVSEYGEDKVGDKVLDAWKKGMNTEFKVVHAVYPRDAFSGGLDTFHPFISQTVLEDDFIELKLGGFREWPYTIPRWTKSSIEVYGRSPAMNALSDMKTLNKMTETMLIAMQKTVDPPIQMPDDGYVMPIITRAGGINYKRPGSEDIKPVFNMGRLDVNQQAIEDRRQRIRQSFFVDQLQLQQGPQMTATEVLQRTEEKNRLLGPVLGRMQSEFLRPMIDRVFEVMERRDMILPAPPELEGRQLDVVYSSMIARSQKIGETQNVLRTFEAIAPFIQIDPSVADMFNGDEVTRVVARALNFPQRALRSEKEVEAIRKGRAQAQQKANEQQEQAQQAESAGKAAPALAAANQQG